MFRNLVFAIHFFLESFGGATCSSIAIGLRLDLRLTKKLLNKLVKIGGVHLMANACYTTRLRNWDGISASYRAEVDSLCREYKTLSSISARAPAACGGWAGS